MRNLLAFFAFLLLSFLAVGWWLDWYKVRTSSTDGQPTLNVEFNTKKMGEDMKKTEEYVAKLAADRAARLEAEKKAAEAKKAEMPGEIKTP
ncbi:MAG: hypothetical protein K2W96_23170 [Gemmataceae bacterium]|nr:hypothetical protein [Gemmataceae bacterium]